MWADYLFEGDFVIRCERRSSDVLLVVNNVSFVSIDLSAYKADPRDHYIWSVWEIFSIFREATFEDM